MPSSKFEIDRLVELETQEKRNIPLITINPFSNTSEAIKKGKLEFKKIRGVMETAFGDISISNYAFRHLTRKGRNRNHVNDSLALIKHVRYFLGFAPNKIVALPEDGLQNQKKVNNEILVRRKVLFIYKNIRFSDAGLKNVFIRFDEKIIYPENWKTPSIKNQEVKQSLRLESIYRK